jgi:SAM-dependent methyltransferase
LVFIILRSQVKELTDRFPGSRYEVDDVELEWAFKPDSFDFIHARNLGQSLDDWLGMLRQAYRCLKPGGYIELAEIGGELSQRKKFAYMRLGG